MTLTEFAREADLPKSTALRFLRTLAEIGWVYRDQSGVYSVWAKPGDHQSGDLGPLGTVSARFT